MAGAYGTIWAMIAVIAVMVVLTGNMTATVAVALGFLVIGMIFAGMMMVLPVTVAQRNHPDVPETKTSRHNRFVPSFAVRVR